MIGRRRAFSIGCVIYGMGSLTTALAPNLAVLVLGWSVLEGIGAALILPAIVALVAGNVPPQGRPRAYGLVMGAGAIAVAVGPLMGGVGTTYLSWRWVFVGEVVIVAAILVLARRVSDAPVQTGVRLDVVGAVLAAIGLGAAVFGVLRSSEWGWVVHKPGGPSVLGVSPTVWFVLGGLLVVWLFLSVSLGLSALQTGVRILPLSITLLAAAVGVPRLFPGASPRRVVRLGLLAMLAGIVVLLAAIDVNASARIVTVPLLLAGLGIGALASQLGAVTVSAVPDELSPEVVGCRTPRPILARPSGRRWRVRS
jgi:MFS family permease